jgi:hypothetical protein
MFFELAANKQPLLLMMKQQTSFSGNLQAQPRGGNRPASPFDLGLSVRRDDNILALLIQKHP